MSYGLEAMLNIRPYVKEQCHKINLPFGRKNYFLIFSEMLQNSTTHSLSGYYVFSLLARWNA
jgi:hypothetical protein